MRIVADYDFRLADFPFFGSVKPILVMRIGSGKAVVGPIVVKISDGEKATFRTCR